MVDLLETAVRPEGSVCHVLKDALLMATQLCRGLAFLHGIDCLQTAYGSRMTRFASLDKFGLQTECTGTITYPFRPVIKRVNHPKNIGIYI